MGLCKCPKKRVTQQFCYEHKVNVCEFCMVNSHPNCIVQRYLQWLEDSSYKPVCTLCHLNLSNEECIRLQCYHVFHWTCLNKYAESLPVNTAPAGYTCPDCHLPLFPSSNAPGPITALLRKKLASMDWARAGLGLPILSVAPAPEAPAKKELPNGNPLQAPMNPVVQTLQESILPQSNVIIHHTPQPPATPTSNSVPVSVNNVSNYINFNSTNKNNGTMDSNSTKFASYNSSYTSAVRKPFAASESAYSTTNESYQLLIDVDEDKYRQKTTFEYASKWLRYHRFTNIRTFRRLILLGVILFLLFIIFLSYFARSDDTIDPLLDPRFNPNIHNQEDNFN